MRIMAALGVMVTMIGFGGCGDSRGGGTVDGHGPGGATTGEVLVAELKAAQCGYEVRCGLARDEATCLDTVVFDETNVLTAMADVEAGIVTYDDAKAQACVAAYAHAECSVVGDGTRPFEPCGQIFTGTVATRGACVVSAECAGRGYCLNDDSACNDLTSCCAGTCSPDPGESGIGGPCGTGNIPCVAGAYCEFPFSADDGVCTAQIETEGAECHRGDACKPPLLCELPTGNTPGSCKVLPAHGETCSVDSVPCSDIADDCDPTTLTCTHRAAVGDACSATGVACAVFATCDPTTNRCVDHGLVGASCDASRFGDCAGELQCIDGACAASPPGMTCAL